MNITQKRLAKIVGRSVVTLEKYLCRAEFNHIEKVKVGKRRQKGYTNVKWKDVTMLKKLSSRQHQPKDKLIENNQYEKEYEKYYHRITTFGQDAAVCFDFNFSYKTDDSETCFLNFEKPCICKVLKGQYCCMLANQLGQGGK